MSKKGEGEYFNGVLRYLPAATDTLIKDYEEKRRKEQGR
jgi:hypothetical protein